MSTAIDRAWSDLEIECKRLSAAQEALRAGESWFESRADAYAKAEARLEQALKPTYEDLEAKLAAVSFLLERHPYKFVCDLSGDLRKILN